MVVTIAKDLDHFRRKSCCSNSNCPPTIQLESRFISGKSADLASRGFNAPLLVKSSLWWTGPAWLSAPEDNWPESQPMDIDPPEKRENVQILHSRDSDDELTIIDPSNYSSLAKTIRSIAYVLHFVDKVRKKALDKPLEPKNLVLAKFHLCRLDLQTHFPNEYDTLLQNCTLDSKSPLPNLAPFMDTEFMVIRVGGRLGQSQLSADKRFPVLISKKSNLAPLIIHQFHEASLHGGGLLTLNLIRQGYWITNSKPLVNQFIRKCITCYRFNTTPPTQLMADLPAE